MAEAALVARLEARMDKYEKAMKGAEDTADKTVNNIERRFSAAQFGDRLGREIGRGLQDAFSAVVRLIQETIEQLEKMERVAALTGITLREAFALEKVVGPGTVEAFQTIATQLDRMQRGEKNYLSKLFDANGIQNVKTAAEAFEQVRRIINDLQDPLHALEVGKAFQMSTENVDNIRKARDNFQGLKEAAAATGPDVEHLNRLAKEFAETWESALAGLKSAFLTTFNGAKNIVNDFVRDTATVLRALDFGPMFGRTGALGRLAGQLEDASRGGPAGESGRVRALAGVGQTAAAAAGTGIDTSRRGAKVPSLGGGGGGGGGKDTLDAFEREERRATERAAQLRLEATLVGKTTEERSKALETLRLEQMAIRENLTLDEARRATIAKIAEGYAKSTAELEAARRAQERMSFFGNTLVDALDRATTAGAKLKDIIADIGATMKRALIQGLITGQGPFGGGPGSGFMSLLPKFQTGGVVPGSGPVPIMAHGGEVVVPKAVAQRGGMGATFAPIYNIDARGAQAGVADQIAAAMAANNRALQVTLPSMIRNAQGRGSLR